MRDINEIFDEIVQVCQDYCDKNYIDVDVEFAEDFCYYVGANTVGITIMVDERANYFMKNAFDMGLKYDCGDFILSFFHEIGHHYTENWITKKENKKCKKQKKHLDGSIEKDNYTYFKIYDEILATDWAIDYINENIESINDFTERLQTLINEIELEN